MEAKDLMIGNIVYANIGDCICKVTDICETVAYAINIANYEIK